jgi:hypothetical protein
LARRIAIPLGVAFLILCSGYQVAAKVTITDWYVVGVAVLLVAGAMITVFARTKCPRCRLSLRKVVAQEGSPTLRKLDACPHCGVSLDEAMESPIGRSVG